MSDLTYEPKVGDLVTATLPSRRDTLHLLQPGTVFEIVSVDPLQITHTCEPPIGVELRDVAPIHPHGYHGAKLSTGRRVRTHSHDWEACGVPWVRSGT